MTTPSLPLPLGKIVADYRLETVLGRGGQGVVYRASQLNGGADVAIKVAAASTGVRLVREARLLGDLRHPNIVSVRSLDAAAQPPYLVLELLGESLADRMQRHSSGLPQVEVLRIALAICNALAEAHKRGIVHRDLKPQNVLFDAAGRAKVADFGLGVDLTPELAHSLSLRTVLGVVGTPLYFAPEQEDPALRGQIGARTDLYAFGKLLYFMLTGNRPRTIRSIAGQRADVAKSWDALVFKLVEDRPARRPASVEAVRSWLHEIRRNQGIDLRTVAAAEAPAASKPAPTAPPEPERPAPRVLAQLRPGRRLTTRQRIAVACDTFGPPALLLFFVAATLLLVVGSVFLG